MAVTSARRVAVLTPWYPTRQQPFGGTFVEAMVRAVAPGCDEIALHHFDSWGAAMTIATESAVLAAQDALRPDLPATVGRVANATVGYHPVPVVSRSGRPRISRLHAEAMRRAFGGPIPAPVVHAHVGTPTAWAALQNLAPGAELYVTEHMSFLADILAEPESRAMYGEVLAGCTKLFAVGQVLVDQLLDAFPEHAGKIVIVPNPVEFGPERAEPVRELLRWLYVGSFIERKAVHLIVEAFAACRADDPRLTLTLVGAVGDSTRLHDLAASLGVADAVTFTGAVPHAESLRLMGTHDLLLHASRWETFGMTPVEAISAGTPVVVTRCGGPEETLADVVDVAGELVAVEDTAGSLIAGYRRLRDRFDTRIDLAEARRRLVARYGPAAVAAHHHHHWFGDPAPADRPAAVPPQRRAADAPVTPGVTA
ncbi:hypothetical protein GCM10010123_29590 [Pilimelia anulata]|uniref:Glycosyl transferase family 1 domain-containing protein n=1 Tax=Pilimelia anulata TaxID=53371 RepID=A0A8J3BAV6_9ACTN|nr:glycosyltransferase [Pilimelia anulata]GGJ97668.1 hypothetical protein GCM10010123_29590 [Pilimelia anulata]